MCPAGGNRIQSTISRGMVPTNTRAGTTKLPAMQSYDSYSRQGGTAENKTYSRIGLLKFVLLHRKPISVKNLHNM
jgi:hypothetical protein